MKKHSTLFIALDTHKGSIAVAYAIRKMVLQLESRWCFNQDRHVATAFGYHFQGLFVGRHRNKVQILPVGPGLNLHSATLRNETLAFRIKGVCVGIAVGPLCLAKVAAVGIPRQFPGAHRLLRSRWSGLFA